LTVLLALLVSALALGSLLAFSAAMLCVLTAMMHKPAKHLMR
jgi:hypothetical protein